MYAENEEGGAVLLAFFTINSMLKSADDGDGKFTKITESAKQVGKLWFRMPVERKAHKGKVTMK